MLYCTLRLAAHAAMRSVRIRVLRWLLCCHRTLVTACVLQCVRHACCHSLRPLYAVCNCFSCCSAHCWHVVSRAAGALVWCADGAVSIVGVTKRLSCSHCEQYECSSIAAASLTWALQLFVFVATLYANRSHKDMFGHSQCCVSAGMPAPSSTIGMPCLIATISWRVVVLP